MAVDISAEITRNWPETEAKLTAEPSVGYSTQKTAAIARAKRDAYGTATIPAEASIPDAVAYWIADKATIYLIPLAKQYYAIHERVSDSKENANFTYYNKVALLDGLRKELETACAENWETVQDLVGASGDADEIPAVSTDGMAIDPLARAGQRGPW